MNSVLVCYTGKRGAGKTTTMVLDAYNYHLRDINIYTNMKSLTFGKSVEEKDIITLIEDKSFKNCVLMIDEIQVIFDSRRSGRKENINFLYFIQQIRKRNITLLYTTQFSRRVDVGIREHTDIEARPKMVETSKGLVCDVTYTDITASIDEGKIIETTKIYDPANVFVLFDTSETINSLDVIKKNLKGEKKS